MQKLRVASFSVSIDGYGAGPEQNINDPLGKGGLQLHQWFFPTKAFRTMHGEQGGEEGIDNNFAVKGFENIGAWILGRNMFGPVRGNWPDDSWKGWWGENPPYHVPVFVLTNYYRPPLEMQGGTTFYFVTGGIEKALKEAFDSAGGMDVRLGGGVSTIRQYLNARLVDELHIAVSPVLLGKGENLFGGIDLPALGYQCVETVPSKNAAHMFIKKT